MQLEHGKIVITTSRPEVLCIPPQDTSNLSPCNHEEADTRMILHLSHAFHEGFQNILLRTADTYVVVLTIAAVSKLGMQESWVAFGTGKSFRYIPVHEIAASLGPNKCQALPMFHAYTGCDTVSAFYSKWKKSACKTWNVYEAVTMAFMTLSVGNAKFWTMNWEYWNALRFCYEPVLWPNGNRCYGRVDKGGGI
ncbi:hypothetical protein BSL78_01300 [Apostichopus japonicus]|uniref:Uncharacterized protein n=1 Tax=Stichopus japonicus TaxID=307972 RepID=A0A2G8LNA5_STIJA|nr:hypothetical protein BSL78_01300 [Apostichopus japonicus]